MRQEKKGEEGEEREQEGEETTARRSPNEVAARDAAMHPGLSQGIIMYKPHYIFMGLS